MPTLRSFALTTPQMRCGLKWVTRRLSCNLKPGQLICATDKSQRVGPLYEELGIWEVLRVSDPAPLCDGLDASEVTAEGFTGWTSEEFAAMFCAGKHPDTIPVHRVELRATPETAQAIAARIVDARLAAQAPGRPLLVGQAPTRGTHNNSDGWPAFYGGPAGRRLGRLLGADWQTTVRTFERTNLLRRWPGQKKRGHRFPADLARRAAVEIAPQLTGRVVICAGRAVWDAVCRTVAPGHCGDDPLSVVELKEGPRIIAHLPHPSGFFSWWNDEENTKKAADWLRDLVGEARTARDPTVKPCVPVTAMARRVGNAHPFSVDFDGSSYCPVCGRWL